MATPSPPRATISATREYVDNPLARFDTEQIRKASPGTRGERGFGTGEAASAVALAPPPSGAAVSLDGKLDEGLDEVRSAMAARALHDARSSATLQSSLSKPCLRT